MRNGVQVYRLSRRLPSLLFGLAAISAGAPFLPNDRYVYPLGYVFMAAIPVALATLGSAAWRYCVCVDETTIEIGAFTRRSYAISGATSIDVQMTKAGRVATVKFSDGRSLSFGKDLVGFQDLLSLISLRSSLPVTKPVWDP